MLSETPTSQQQEKPKDVPEGVENESRLDQTQQLNEGGNILTGQVPQKPMEEAKDPRPQEQKPERTCVTLEDYIRESLDAQEPGFFSTE